MVRKLQNPVPHPLTTSLAANQASLPNPYAFPQQKTRAHPPLDAHFLRKPEPRPRVLPKLHYGDITEVPTLYPTIQEMECPQAFIDSIKIYESYGMVKIVPPRELDIPPLGIDTELYTMRSRHQLISQKLTEDEIQVEFCGALTRFHATRGVVYKAPLIQKQQLNMYLFFRSVEQRGGMHEISRRKMWQQVGRELGYSGKIMSSLSTTLKVAYSKLLHPFSEYCAQNGVKITCAKLMRFRVTDDEPKQGEHKLPCGIIATWDFPSSGNDTAIISGSETERIDLNMPNWRKGRYSTLRAVDKAPAYNLKQFQQKAQLFYDGYYPTQPSSSELENEYWRLLQSKKECVAVEYAYSMIGQCGLPAKWEQSPWHTSNLSNSDGSFLKYIDNERLTNSWIDAGMLFATQAWTVEPYLSAMLSYNHLGAARTWYSTPPKCFDQMVDIIPLRDNNKMPTPQQLAARGIKCYGVEQYPDELVFIFPGSFHAHFDHGFNVAGSIHYMQSSWIDAGRHCLKLYHKLKLRAPFSWEQLIVNAAHGTNLGILQFVLPELDRVRTLSREYFAKFPKSNRPFTEALCVKTNQVLFMHYVDTPEGPVNPEFADKGSGELVTTYSGPEFFDELMKIVEHKVNGTHKYVSHVCDTLVTRKYHTVESLRSLAAQAPDTNWAKCTGMTLKWAADSLVCAQLDRLHKRGGVATSGQLEQIDASLKQSDALVDEIGRWIAQPHHQDLVKQLGEFSSKLESIPLTNPLLAIVRDLYQGVLWAQTIAPVVKGLLFKEQVEGLLADASRYRVPPDCDITQSLLQRHRAGQELQPAAERAVAGDPIELDQLRQMVAQAQTAAIGQQVYTRLALLLQTLELVEQTGAADFRQRPRYSVAVQFRAMHQQLGWAVLQCEQWFQSLGYPPQLLAQAEAALRGADCPGVMQVSLQLVLPILDRLQLLQVVPDNIDDFVRAADGLKQLINSGQVHLLQRYGFI